MVFVGDRFHGDDADGTLMVFGRERFVTVSCFEGEEPIPDGFAVLELETVADEVMQ